MKEIIISAVCFITGALFAGGIAIEAEAGTYTCVLAGIVFGSFVAALSYITRDYGREEY